MKIHETHGTVSPEGSILVGDLPFKVGEDVKIIIESLDETPSENPYPLRGTPYRWDDPFSPLVSPDDWKPFE